MDDKFYKPMSWQFKANAYDPVDYKNEKGDAGPLIWAMRAFSQGKATEGQQRLVWAWWRYASAVDDWPYRPEQRQTDVMLGRQFVFKQALKFLDPIMTPRGESEVDVPALARVAKTRRKRKA